MAIQSVQDFVKSRQDLVQKLRENMQAAVQKQAPKPEELLARRGELAEQTRERLTSHKAARAKAVERYDKEIRRQEEILARIEADDKEERERLEKARKGGDKPDKPEEPEPPEPPEPPTGPAKDVNLEVKVVRVGNGPRQVVGKVTDASGKPLPDLKLELFEKGSDKPARNATTDKKGEFAFMDVSAGALTVKLHVGDKVIEKKVSSR